MLTRMSEAELQLVIILILEFPDKLSDFDNIRPVPTTKPSAQCSRA
jgi:hypothetical protein